VSLNAGILAHYESRTSRPTQFIPVDVAELLVQRMVAERLSRRVIRLFSPESVFQAAKFFPQPSSPSLEAINLDSPELPGLRFVLPPEAIAAWRLVRAKAAISLAAEYRWE
jgi:hypothetical protein